jgi:ABC-2 type transport system permease protein
MSTASYALADAATMLRRSLRRAARYPALTIGSLMVPVVVLLLFAGLLGDTLGAGIGDRAGDASYIDYVVPGIVLMTAASTCMGTAVSVCMDMTGGLVDRFRTMDVSRAALLSGHVGASLIVTLASVVLVVPVALLLGFRPQASVLDGLALLGLLVLVALALTWLAVLIGLRSRTPESASNTPLLVQFLPFLSSAFVPVDAMPASVRWFAELQPFTPIIETARGLLLGTPAASDAIAAVGWCLAIGTLSYLAARTAFDRPRTA